MYQKHNDYELIYLFFEGEESALKEIYNKYEHFLHKFYFDRRINFISRIDFLQEGFMILQKAIYSYNPEGTISFYTFYNICLKRRINNMRCKSWKFNEESILELNDLKDINNYSNYLLPIIKRELSKEDKEITDMFFECVVRGTHLKTYCRLHNKNYELMYYKYKKLIRDLRKKVD